MSEKSCCFCFSLRTGTLAIGITMLALGGLVTATAVGALIYVAGRESPRPGQYDTLRLILGFQLTGGIVHLFFSSLLIHGVTTRRVKLVWAWLIYHAVTTAVQSVTIGVLLGIAFHAKDKKDIAVKQTAILLVCCIAGNIGFWQWLEVAVQYYREMRRELLTAYRQSMEERVGMLAT